VGPQQLTAGDVTRAESLRQARTLGAFAGSRRTEQDESQEVMIARDGAPSPTQPWLTRSSTVGTRRRVIGNGEP
jgi:hypothetical protein